MKKYLYILAILVAASCTAPRTTTVANLAIADVLSLDATWQLTMLSGQEPATATPITLILNPETHNFKGFGGCNEYYGRYTATLQSASQQYTTYALRFENIGHTRTQCPDNQMKDEAKLLSLLPKVDECHLTAYTLTMYRRGKEIIRFERQMP